MTADPRDDDSINNARDFLISEIDTRRRMFSAEGAANLEAYRETSGKDMPAIIVVVDNLASLSTQSPDLMDALNITARDGGSLGIYLMITAGSRGGFIYNISQYVKSNHTLQMTDKKEYRAITGGDGTVYPAGCPGRGMTTGGLEYHAPPAMQTEAGTSKPFALKCHHHGQAELQLLNV